MVMGVNTNIMALNAQRQLGSTQNEMQTAMERLSSGLRINSAADDAAGLAITDRMTSQIRGLNQAVRNANDGISLAQTAEGAMQESTNILQRMRELAIQSANDTNSSSDRANLQKEVNQLQAELNRISETTTFNGQNILDGSFSSQKFQVGANANETISVSVGNTAATAMGSYKVESADNVGGLSAAADVSGGNGVVDANDLTINGSQGSSTIAVGDNMQAAAIASAINADSGETGVSATASTSAVLKTADSGTISFTLSSGSSDSTAQAISAGVESDDLSNLAQAINDRSASTGVTATLSADKTEIALENSQGYDINILDADHSDAATNALTIDGNNVVKTDGSTGTATDSMVIGGQVVYESEKSFNVSEGGTPGINGSASEASSLSSVAEIDISTQTGSNSALSVIDKALSFISNSRADLGAIQNRLDSTISNLQSVSENVSAARSQIQDADFAQETSNLSRSQILQQAGTAMLSQANASQQNVLSLLG